MTVAFRGANALEGPVPEFIERLYVKRVGKRRPDVVVSIEARNRMDEARKARKREPRRQRAGEDVQG